MLTLTNARIPGERGLLGSLINLTLRDGRIAAIDFVGATGAISLGALADARDDSEHVEIDLGGRYVIPGLWDAHTHFTQWAQTRRRLDLSAAASADEVVALVRSTLAIRDGAIIGFGWRGSLWKHAPHKGLLDAVTGSTPVVLISADLHSVWLNSAALVARGISHPTGVLTERDAFSVQAGLSSVPVITLDSWVHEAAQEAAARGVVGIVDFEMDWNAAAWRRRIGNGCDLLRVEFGIYREHLDRAIESDLRTGEVVASTGGLLRVGAYKVIVDGSLGTRTAFCHKPYKGMHGPAAHGQLTVPYPRLVQALLRASGNGIDPAVHAIGDAANRFAINAFDELGVSGSIEHAQLMDWDDVRRMGDLGIRASVQPEHVLDDRHVAEQLWGKRTRRAFAFRSMLDAGVPLAFGSDAPVAPLDPWRAIAAAVDRTQGDLPPWHPEQRISVAEALEASTRGRIAVGEVADLAVLDIDPLECTTQALRHMPVALTVLGGRITHSAL
jgi:predicted amidohydrolase YtcJ